MNIRDCEHGRQIGKCADCDVAELEALRRQDEALIKQMLGALQASAGCYGNPRSNDAINAARARLGEKT